MKKRNLSQEKIIRCARELAKEKDIQLLTFQDLAKELDIKAPSLYNHFKNMQEVRSGLTAMLLQELNETLRRALVGKSQGAALFSYAEIYQTFAYENQEVYELLINVPQMHDERLLEKTYETTDIIMQILEGYQLSKEERIHFSRQLRSLVHGYLSLRFMGYFTKEADVEPDSSYQKMIQQFVADLDIYK
ncbi:TetR/AcrR family transcriptional regulator [Enterococcus canis]|nr:TetR/AcrR family transcriptional regulator [Enterococcus canis]